MQQTKRFTAAGVSPKWTSARTSLTVSCFPCPFFFILLYIQHNNLDQVRVKASTSLWCNYLWVLWRWNLDFFSYQVVPANPVGPAKDSNYNCYGTNKLGNACCNKSFNPVSCLAASSFFFSSKRKNSSWWHLLASHMILTPFFFFFFFWNFKSVICKTNSKTERMLSSGPWKPLI
jgi:hypothetical protein